IRPRGKDHRDSVVGTALLRIEDEPHRCSQALAGTTFSRRERRCRELTRAADVARSTPANPPRKGSSRNSTRSPRSAKPARPSSAASAMRAGYWSEPAMTDGGSRLHARGAETKLVLPGLAQQRHSSRCDPALIKAIARGRAWFEELVSGRAQSLQDLAKRDGISRRYIRRLIGLAFLSPE